MELYDVLYKDDSEKGKWHKVGLLIIKDDGRMSIKIDLIPSVNWNGWLTVSKKGLIKKKYEENNEEYEEEPF